jgi:hypothetical protein
MTQIRQKYDDSYHERNAWRKAKWFLNKMRRYEIQGEIIS